MYLLIDFCLLFFSTIKKVYFIKLKIISENSLTIFRLKVILLIIIHLMQTHLDAHRQLLILHFLMVVFQNQQDEALIQL